MLVIIEEYTNTLLGRCEPAQDNSQTNNSFATEERRLKPIEERWRQKKNKRNQGYYTKAPEEPVLTDLISSLLSARQDINANLKLPCLSPDWLNVSIGLILSTGNNNEYRRSISSSSSNTNPLLYSIETFIEEWLSSTTNSYNVSLASINLPSSIGNFDNSNQMCEFILEQILKPILPCHLIVNKIYSCTSCKTMKQIRSTISHIPVNVLRAGLNIDHQLFGFFSPTSSDIPCDSCKRTTTRHIEVLQWPSVFIMYVNECQRNVKSRKPPDMLSLAQFSRWTCIGLPSSMVYSLVCFSSVLQVNNNELIVRSTRIKKSWTTSINKRLIGEGDQLKRLFANSRKWRNFQQRLKIILLSNIS
jgi:hypothetical protein